MNKSVVKWAAAVVIAFAVGYSTPHGLNQKTGPSPFSVSVVPAWSGPSGRGISMATDSHDRFYVLLTNVSKDTQFAFEPWHSWGYYAVSFEAQTEDGHKFTIHLQKANGVHEEHSVNIRHSTR